MKLTTTYTLALAILAALIQFAAGGATAHAQSEPAPAPPACTVAVADALDGLDQIDAVLERSEARIASAQQLTTWLARASDVDELELIDRQRDAERIGVAVNRTATTLDEAQERGVAGGILGEMGLGDPLTILFGLMGLGGAGAGVFRGMAGRWPGQDKAKAAQRQMARARKLATDAHTHQREEATISAALQQLLSQSENGRTQTT